MDSKKMFSAEVILQFLCDVAETILVAAVGIIFMYIAIAIIPYSDADSWDKTTGKVIKITEPGVIEKGMELLGNIGKESSEYVICRVHVAYHDGTQARVGVWEVREDPELSTIDVQTIRRKYPPDQTVSVWHWGNTIELEPDGIKQHPYLTVPLAAAVFLMSAFGIWMFVRRKFGI